ncbi:MAG TPA: hypothetical protein VMU54_06305 [Planctomycetota bacterium]|nr:hypothetical protein [Planctomycetota bacterium]
MTATMLALVLALQSEELAEAAKKTSALESYSFKNEAKASAKPKNQPGAIEGHYQKDQPLSLKSGSAEGFKKAGLVVYKDGDDWKTLEKPQKGEKKKAQPVAALFAGVKLPHEEMENFDKNFEKVEKAAEKDKDCTVWSGALTPSAARSLVSTGSKAEGKSQASYTGTAKVWINEKGLIVRYEISAHMKGETKKGPVESDITRTVEITEGGAPVEIPEAAKKLLEGQP